MKILRGQMASFRPRRFGLWYVPTLVGLSLIGWLMITTVYYVQPHEEFSGEESGGRRSNRQMFNEIATGEFSNYNLETKENIKSYCRKKLESENKLGQPDYLRKQMINSLNRKKGIKHNSAMPGEKVPEKDLVKFISDTNNFMEYCHVPKAASSTWMYALAKINKLTPDMNELKELLQKGMLHGIMFEKYGHFEDDLPGDDNSVFKFTFVRHPFERIVSAYHDKFVHLLDKSFIQPVIDWEAGLFGRLTATVSKNNATNVATNTFLMKFEKFVRFILYEIENNMQSYGSLHWWPFSRLCGLCHIDYDFIGKVENLESDVNYLARTKLSMYQNLVQSVFENKLNKNQHKSEKTSHLYFQQLPKDLVMKLYSVFEDDFHLGGYDYPQTYLDAAALKK